MQGNILDPIVDGYIVLSMSIGTITVSNSVYKIFSNFNEIQENHKKCFFTSFCMIMLSYDISVTKTVFCNKVDGLHNLSCLHPFIFSFKTYFL